MTSSRRVKCLYVLMNLLSFVASSSWSSSSSAQAQIIPFPGLDNSGNAENDGNPLHSERRVETKLTELSAAARKKNTTEVLEHLESLRAADPMLMVRESDRIFVPLHRDLIRRIQAFRPELHEAIERAVPGAEASLKTTIKSDSETSVGLVIFLQRFAGTRAAAKAHLLLAAKHADRGHNLAAQYWLAPLLSSQADPELKAIAEKMNARLTEAEDTNHVNAKEPGAKRLPEEKSTSTEVPVTDEAATGAQSDANQSERVESSAISGDAKDGVPEGDLESQTTENGDVSTAPSSWERHWYNTLPITATARTRSQQLLREAAETKNIPWSAWQPELDSRHVYVRAPGLISAYQLRSGEHLWTRTLSQEQSNVRSPEPDFMGGGLQFNGDRRKEALNSPEILLLHRNEMVGRMTSDAERLYLVSQVHSGHEPPVHRGMMRIRGIDERASLGLWELVAIDKETGRRLWTMGGSPVEEKFGNELAMAWLAGPPAVDRGSLYQVIERDSVLQLVCLDAATGRLRWLLPLAYPEYGIEKSYARQFLAAQTTAQRGLVFTTSTNGWLFAIDTLTHTILWARKLAAHSLETEQQRLMRDTGMFATDLAPQGQSWRSQPPVLTGDSLLVPTAESPSLLCVDVKSGKTRSTSIPTSGPTVVLHCDQQWLVLGSAESIIGFSVPKLKRSWTLELKNSAAPPVGPASLQNDELYVPLADGSAAVVLIADGTLKQTLKSFRPAWSTGGLYSTEDRILSFAPDHLMLMSQEPVTRHDETDPLQHAIFQFESGNLQEAARAAAGIPLTALNRDTVRRLKFRIAVAMLSAGGSENSQKSSKELIAKEATQLAKIAEMAQTAQEKALTHFLRLDFLMRTAPENVVPSLIDALSLDESVHKVTVPVTSSLKELLVDASGNDPLTRNPLRPVSDEQFVTFRAWVLMQLRDRIANADSKERSSIVLALAALSDALIVEMHSKNLVEESLRRVESQLQNGECNELTLQLLLSAAEAQFGTSPAEGEQQIKISARIAEAFGKARALLSKKSSAGSVHQELIERLLSVVQYELQGKQPGVSVVAPDDTRAFIVNRVANTPELPLTMVPVSNTGRMMGRMAERSPLDPGSASDSFLSGFRWSVRKSPVAVQASSVRELSREPWVIRRDVSENFNELRNHELYRFGTVLIVADSEGLAAFSVAEQRWLWRKTADDGFSGLRSMMGEHTFSRVDTGMRFVMMSIHRIGLNLCGGSTRWLCLRTDNTIEVLDVYSGNRLWGMPLQESFQTGLAFRSAVFNHRGFRDVKQLNPVDGKGGGEIPVKVESLSPMEIVRETPNSILAMKRPESLQGPALEWIDPETGDVLKEIELPSKSHASLLDQETMALLSESGDLKVINLMTGDQQEFTNAVAATANVLPKDPNKLGFHADALNYYLYEADENGMGRFSFEMSRLISVKTAVVAFSRNTGKLAWVHQLKGSGNLYLEGPDEIVVLAEVSEKVVANAGGRQVINIPGLGLQMGQVYVLKGLSRANGLTRFSHQVAALRPFPEIRLTKTNTNQLDLEAFGTRVRFLSSPVAVAP